MNAPAPLSGHDLMPLDERLEVAMHNLSQALSVAATARADAENMEAAMKQKKAVLFLKYKSGGESAATAEQMALADPIYAEALADYMKANLAYRRLDAEADAAKLRFEAWRTLNANKRAEMNLR
jgi:hypothetical protein